MRTMDVKLHLIRSLPRPVETEFENHTDPPNP